MASSIATPAVTVARQRMSSDYEESPSPSQISPGLTQSASNSASNTSSSPPELMTPPRANRHRNRYPDLGRVPLHRRGTSKQYERLEDLLKEAGYKETRIFTPEQDRVEQHAERDGSKNEDNRLSVVKDGVGAVVGFLTGLMPGVSGQKGASSANQSSDQLTASPQEYSPPLSPLAYRHSPRSLTTLDSESTAADVPPSAMTSSFGSIEPISTSQDFSHPDIVVHASTPYQRRTAAHNHATSSQPSSRLQHQSSRGSFMPTQDSSHVVSPRPSRATAYLRHMASAPSIPQRPSSTPINGHNRSQLSLNESDYDVRSSRPHTSVDGVPPLPSTWLETVARAVLFGGAGSHIGGPPTSSTYDGSDTPTTASTITQPRQVLRTTRSSISQTSHYTKRPPTMTRSGLWDQTNTRSSHSRPARHPPPPPSALFRGRSGRLDNEVSLTRVVCRSAPGSRTGSLVRGASMDGREKRRDRERGRNGRRGEGAKDALRVPSLARTQVEGDMWSSTEDSRRRRGSRSHLGSSGGRRSEGGDGGKQESSHHISGSDGDDDDEEEEEEDGNEVTLAQMLLPPKRQNSIRSLRKHLASGGGDTHVSSKHVIGGADGAGVDGRNRSKSTVSRVGTNGLVPRTAGVVDEEDSDVDEPGSEHLSRWRAQRNPRAKKRNRGSDDEDVDAFAGFYSVGGEPMGSGRSRAGKSRLGINSAWGLIGGNS